MADRCKGKKGNLAAGMLGQNRLQVVTAELAVQKMLGDFELNLNSTM